MAKINKKRDFIPTDFIGKGLNLVSNSDLTNFYLVDEKSYDSANQDDELECEELYSIENENNIQYFRHNPKVTVVLKRGLLQSVLLQS